MSSFLSLDYREDSYEKPVQNFKFTDIIILIYLVNLEGGFDARIVADTLSVYAGTFQSHQSKFALVGPFFKINIAF